MNSKRSAALPTEDNSTVIGKRMHEQLHACTVAEGGLAVLLARREMTLFSLDHFAKRITGNNRYEEPLSDKITVRENCHRRHLDSRQK